MTRWGVFLLVLALCAIIAAAAGNLRLILPHSTLSRSGAWIIRGIGALAVAVGLIGMVGFPFRLGQRPAHSPPGTSASLRTAATIMGLLTIAALVFTPPVRQDMGDPNPCLLFGCPERSPPSDEEGAPSVRQSRGGGFSGNGSLGGGGGRSAAGLAGLTQMQDAIPDQVGLFERLRGYLPLLFLLLTAGTLFVYARWYRNLKRIRKDTPLSPTEAESGLEASLDAVIVEGGEPRERVTASYLRLLAALAEAGAPREPQEAPHEYLHRVLGPLGVRPRPLHDLADLYVLAQFSERPVTEQHRTAAARALELSLSDLRLAHPPSGPDPTPSHTEGVPT